MTSEPKWQKAATVLALGGLAATGCLLVYYQSQPGGLESAWRNSTLSIAVITQWTLVGNFHTGVRSELERPPSWDRTARLLCWFVAQILISAAVFLAAHEFAVAILGVGAMHHLISLLWSCYLAWKHGLWFPQQTPGQPSVTAPETRPK